MLNEVLPYFLYVYSLLYQAIMPCSIPEQLPANTVDRQQYLGKWYFKAAVSQKEADIQNFKALDNILFNLEERDTDTLLLTGHIRIGDNCTKKTWTYHLHPEKNDLELEGRPRWKNVLWSGNWANCADCIIVQEEQPPLNKNDPDDSMNRYMLYARQVDVDSGVVTTFLRNAACHNLLATVILPQEKDICT
ncbi:apolipoprotein M [Anabas testudineus]|uniref:Apolipoprotein M n=1 Tax=Anabas testudineus TaxID=64144 RepID=A0A7N5ZTW9_ANATE|nr:apolipoprotein M [Anabas testudineus]